MGPSSGILVVRAARTAGGGYPRGKNETVREYVVAGVCMGSA